MNNKKQVSVYLNTKEYEYIVSKSKDSDIGLSEYFRQMVVKNMALDEVDKLREKHAMEHDSFRY